jgi:hypothetical protein
MNNKEKTVKLLGSEMSEDHFLIKPGRLIEDGVDLVKSLMMEDYKRWSKIPEDKSASECEGSDVIRENMYHEYAIGVGSKNGSKYIRLTTGNRGAAAGFIVNTDNDKKFKKGDLLKAASWSAPARNFARGNVIEDTVDSLRSGSVRWTGIC